MDTLAYRRIAGFLPHAVRCALEKLDTDTLSHISEIRLRAGNVTSVTLHGENRYLTDHGLSPHASGVVIPSQSELDAFVYRFCGGSLYAHETTVKDGYLAAHGIRVGLCGRSFFRSDTAGSLFSAESLVIRLPHHVPGCAEPLIRRVTENGFLHGAGFLVASAPGVGKTTLLRDLAIRLSHGVPCRASPEKSRAYRVVLLDEREELYLPECFEGCLVDVIAGLDKVQALPYAMRALSPEIVVCDEISSEAEAEALFRAHLGGAVLMASVHETSEGGILRKPFLTKLCAEGVFGGVCFLERKGDTVVSRLAECPLCSG